MDCSCWMSKDDHADGLLRCSLVRYVLAATYDIADPGRYRRGLVIAVVGWLLDEPDAFVAVLPLPEAARTRTRLTRKPLVTRSPALGRLRPMSRPFEQRLQRN